MHSLFQGYINDLMKEAPKSWELDEEVIEKGMCSSHVFKSFFDRRLAFNLYTPNFLDRITEGLHFN